ncbi:hypothetical protein NDA00_25865 [Funiculus sociatus GB2-M2]|uniref:hypothetical protein n=1 Tax=Funiculus sociatus TaxID=450527 RepID=UPI0032971207
MSETLGKAKNQDTESFVQKDFLYDEAHRGMMGFITSLNSIQIGLTIIKWAVTRLFKIALHPEILAK